MSGFLGGITSGFSSVPGAVNGVTGTLSGLFGGAGGPPPDQKERPIAFILEDDGAVVDEVTLGLRPEDFSRTDASRLNVHHTLGGAWADNFGPGLPNINISGITGWRGGADGDGEARWKKLRDTLFNGWHNRRKKALEEGRDPSKIKLIYADALSSFTVEVAPIALTLRRSKSRPLLIQYQASLIVLDQNKDQLRYLQGGERRETAGDQGGFLAAVTGALDRIRNAINGVTAWVNKNLVAPIRAFLGFVNKVFSAVLGIVRAVRNLVGTVLAIPLLIARAGTNLFRTIAAVATLPAQIKSDIMGVAGAFSTWECFLRRARSNRLIYGDYTAWYGASNCSSISGGRSVSPLAGYNPFYTLPTATGAVIRVSSAAAASITALATSDPVQRPMDGPTITTHLDTINQGAEA